MISLKKKLRRTKANKNMRLMVHGSTGCFNATQLCKDYHKKFSDWEIQPRSQELVNYYSTKKPFYYYTVNEDVFVQKVLILDIASFISSKVFVECVHIMQKHNM